MLPQRDMKENALGLVLKYVPKNALSFVTGKLVQCPLPGPVRKSALSWFAGRYKLNLDEAELPLENYSSIGDLFTRRLKPGLRPIEADIIHPVDAELTSFGEIKNGTMIQAKGKTYTVGDFLSSPEDATSFEGGEYLTYYLCPTDYHRVHSPVKGELEKAVYIPGYLWPVNNWSVNAIDRLFAINERVVMWMRTPRGRVAVVMVGATNVGKITLAFDPTVVSNAALAGSRKVEREYLPKLSFLAGQELGIFNMGSTVIVLYEKGVLESTSHIKSGPVRLGQKL